MHIGICIPARSHMEIGTAFDLANMSAYTAKHTKHDLSLFTSSGTLIFDQRNNLVKAALEAKCTHILWVDADMRFPKDTIIRLLANNKAIVGVNATTRVEPVKPTAKNLFIDQEKKEGQWTAVDSKDKKGVEKVSALGCGVLLVDTQVYKKMTEPYFWFYEIPGDKILGEDVYFCVKAFDIGFDSFVDHGLSNEIGHIGQYTYSWDDIK